LNAFAFGWQINYTGQGMLNAITKIPQTCLVTPFAWKTASAIFTDGWGGEYRLKHAFSKNMYFFTGIGYAYHDIQSKVRNKE